jgi:hypothetical protein
MPTARAPAQPACHRVRPQSARPRVRPRDLHADGVCARTDCAPAACAPAPIAHRRRVRPHRLRTGGVCARTDCVPTACALAPIACRRRVPSRRLRTGGVCARAVRVAATCAPAQPACRQGVCLSSSSARLQRYSHSACSSGCHCSPTVGCGWAFRPSSRRGCPCSCLLLTAFDCGAPATWRTLQRARCGVTRPAARLPHRLPACALPPAACRVRKRGHLTPPPPSPSPLSPHRRC